MIPQPRNEIRPMHELPALFTEMPADEFRRDWPEYIIDAAALTTIEGAPLATLAGLARALRAAANRLERMPPKHRPRRNNQEALEAIIEYLRRAGPSTAHQVQHRTGINHKRVDSLLSATSAERRPNPPSAPLWHLT